MHAFSDFLRATFQHRAARATAVLLLAAASGCASIKAPADPIAKARRLIDERAYAQGLRLLQPWLSPKADEPADPYRNTEARLLLERVRLDCMTRGPDVDDPAFCGRLAQTRINEPAPPAGVAMSVPAEAPPVAAAVRKPEPAAPPKNVSKAKVGAASGSKASRSTSARPAAAPAAPLRPPLERPVALNFSRASLASVFGVIGQATGLDVIFDRDVPAQQTLSIRLAEVPARTALDKTTLTAGLAWRLLDERSVLIYPDVARKQADYQSLHVRSFFLEHADARFVAGSLRTVLKSRDIVVDEKLNMLVVRDTAEALRQTEQLVKLHDVPEPEVVLDVQVLEVKRSLLNHLGVQWPGSLGLAPLPFQLQQPGLPFAADAPLTLRDLLSATPGRTGLQFGQITLNARREDGDINTLASPRIRARSRERARILIGERVPNVTTTSTATGLVGESIAYVDVGLKLDVQPQVYAGDEVVIRLDLEVSNIIDTLQTRSGTLAYRIGTRNTNTVLRLRDGENQLLAGLVQDSDQRSRAQVPGLGNLPLLGRLFGAQLDETAKTEIVLSITPHLIRPISLARRNDRGFDAGTVSGVRGRSEAEAPAAEPQLAAPAPAGAAPLSGAAPVVAPAPFGAPR